MSAVEAVAGSNHVVPHVVPRLSDGLEKLKSDARHAMRTRNLEILERHIREERDAWDGLHQAIRMTLPSELLQYVDWEFTRDSFEAKASSVWCWLDIPGHWPLLTAFSKSGGRWIHTSLIGKPVDSDASSRWAIDTPHGRRYATLLGSALAIADPSTDRVASGLPDSEPPPF